MNKRQHKNKIKYIIDNIQTINLKENEVLLFKYDETKYNRETVVNFADFIKNQIAQKVLFVPISWDIKKISEYKSPATQSRESR